MISQNLSRTIKRILQKNYWSGKKINSHSIFETERFRFAGTGYINMSLVKFAIFVTFNLKGFIFCHVI